MLQSSPISSAINISIISSCSLAFSSSSSSSSSASSASSPLTSSTFACSAASAFVSSPISINSALDCRLRVFDLDLFDFNGDGDAARGTTASASSSTLSSRLMSASSKSHILSACSTTALRRALGQARGSERKYTTIASKSFNLSKSPEASLSNANATRMTNALDLRASKQSITRPLNRTEKSEAKHDINHDDAYSNGVTSCASKCCASVGFFTRSTAESCLIRVFNPSIPWRYIERKSPCSMSVTKAANARDSFGR
mmetsp:Transcript_4351/g.14242  ORF Transcript_4351/g.14242 Transcript_4351/m.14242 type:complete len:257 (-) Transcript_4351:718-1488(-)